MSTISSLALKEITEKTLIHIYHEMLDGCYYIADDINKIKLNKEIAEKFAKILKD